MSDNDGKKRPRTSKTATVLSVLAAACFLPMLFGLLGFIRDGGINNPGSPTYVISIFGILLLFASTLFQMKFCIERGIALTHVRRFISYLKFGALLSLVFLLLVNVTIVLSPANEGTPREGLAFLLAVFVILTAMWRYLNWKMEHRAIEHQSIDEGVAAH